jgi:hypothetical protein
MVESIKIISAILSIIGSGILAFRVTGILSALSFVAEVHEVNIQQLMPSSNANYLTNLENSTNHINKSNKKGLLITGFACLFLSGVFQCIAIILSNT